MSVPGHRKQAIRSVNGSIRSSNNPYRDIESRGNELFQPEVLPSVPEDTPTFLSFSTKTTSPETHLKRTYTQTKPVDQKEFKIAFEESKSSYTTKEPYATRERESKSTYNRYRHSSLSDPPSVRALLSEQAYISSYEASEDINYSDTAKLTANVSEISRDYSPQPSDQSFEPSSGNPSQSYQKPTEYTSKAHNRQSLVRVATVIRKMSRRVVNVQNHDDTPRLPPLTINTRDIPKQVPKEEADIFPEEPFLPTPAPPIETGPVMELRQQETLESDSDGSTYISRDSTDIQISLAGNSCGLFSPSNRFRQLLASIICWKWTETLIMLLITLHGSVLLAVGWGEDHNPVPPSQWGVTWYQPILLIIFCCYTMAMLMRIVVYGFVINPIPNDGANILPLAFLRHSWNRIDFISVVAYWIDIALLLSQQEVIGDSRRILVFKMLSTLILLRLLNITNGNKVILQSLKKATPLLRNVAFFVLFFFIIFAIVGVQSFKGSYLRRCVWTNPDNSTDIQILQQYCGGYYQDNIEKPFKLLDGRDGPWSKGFICPSGLVCQETANPFGNTISFDNIFSSMLIVMIIAGDQSWTDRMYDMMDAEYYFACLYFIFLVIVMNFWLINLFVAVINEMFAKVREDSKHSAFTTSKAVPLLADADEGWSFGESTNRKAKAKVSALAGMVAMLRPFWVLLVAIDMIVMATKNNNMTSDQLAALDHAELGFTLAFLVEILLRLYSQRRQLGVFFSDRMNKTDTFLAFITCIIWIPPIHDNKIAYAWLTGFQILRIYRIVMVIPRLRRLMSRVLGSVYGLLNLVFFIVLATFLCAIVAFQLFEGNMNNSEEEMRFFSIYNSFAGLYQLFSGEDWTTVLYTNMEAGATSSNSAIYAIFLVLWFAFSNFVLVNMFIAVLMENFETAEEEKKKRQIQYYVEKTEVEFVTDDPIVSRWNIYRYFKAQPKEVQVKNMPAALILPVQKNTVRDFMNEVVENIYVNDKNLKQKASRTGPPVEDGLVPRIQNIFSSLFKTKTDKSHLLANTSRKSLNLDVFNFEQFTTFYDHNKQADNGGPQSMRYLFDTSAKETSNSRVLEEIGNITEERRAVKQDFITAHPTYDKAFYLFSSRNLIRKACQSLVPSSRGERTFGKSPSWYSFIFSVFIISCIITNVVLTIYNSPVYAIKNRDNPEKLIILKYIDITFMVIFTIEFIIKVIADGLLMTPNAYLLNGWNVLDLFVLITLYMYNFGNFAASTGLERVFRAFKALRALRLINLLESAKETFTAILVTGLPQIIDAMFLGLSLIIPFVLYGQNIFQGLLYNCNDSGDTITDKYSCIYEGMLSAAEPMSDDTSIYQPRVWSNPYVYSFDSFGQGLLILFEIASGEGWIDVMTSSMSIQGKDQNPEQDSSQLWGIFFMVYNLAGSVFVISLFLGVVLENFGKRNGTLYLTSDQQRWLDLKKLLSQMKPAKRPKTVPTGSFRKKCFDWAIEKRGRFYKIMTGVICLNILFLCTDSEYEESIIGLSQAKGYVYLLFILAYWIEIFIKLFGLGWNSYRSNLWNIYDLLVVIGSAITIIAAMASSEYQVNVEAQKLFMTALCFKLVQRNDGLNQLFTTMAASAYQIINVFAVWFVVMTTYAIMFMEIFGLTKYGNQATTEHINFRSYANTMTSLVRYSTGEGWNTVMHNFAVESPNCIEAINYLDSDCGSTLWAYCLFLTFNIISMYIFQAIFVAVRRDQKISFF
ncbi:Ion transport protein-domain-containing protein [Spinellus fusiger]|nr:Ion transport protein-domain-containing protein [Spinellus fusiger]